ncbi:hypothetical protein NPIL_71091 [Nephila pilipes]|uniref:Uncharacterized protein n=1 Tax=Nephila pilipes TaxID=299642 RepID=A0A8X6MUP7_NEPPI|nr:hypothetical protein NPIL_71091 [Nephila pilipes]
MGRRLRNYLKKDVERVPSVERVNSDRKSCRTPLASFQGCRSGARPREPEIEPLNTPRGAHSFEITDSLSTRSLRSPLFLSREHPTDKARGIC